MVSATTRPPRDREENGKDYFFVNDEQFSKLIENHQLIEHTHFRGWCYGIPFNEVKPGYINIGVFNLEGLESLTFNKIKYTIIPVYLEEKLNVRLKRSRDREGRWRLEFFRRALTDWRDFRKVHKICGKAFNGRYIYLRQINGVWRQSINITQKLLRWGIFKLGKDDKMRLGNFV